MYSVVIRQLLLDLRRGDHGVYRAIKARCTHSFEGDFMIPRTHGFFRPLREVPTGDEKKK